MRVVIVDDDILIREEIKTFIDWKKQGFTMIFEASNGKDAFLWLQENEADIVITDISMPVMNGVELIRNLKNANFAGQILVMSNYDEFDYVKDAMKYGAFDYCLKYKLEPEGFLNLLNSIAQYIQNNQKQNKADEKNINDRWTYLHIVRNACLGYPSPEEIEIHDSNPNSIKGYYIFYVKHPPLNETNRQIETNLLKKNVLWFALSTNEHAAVVVFSDNSYYKRDNTLMEYTNLLRENVLNGIIAYSNQEIKFQNLYTQICKLRENSRIYFYKKQPIINVLEDYSFSLNLSLEMLKQTEDDMILAIQNTDAKSFKDKLMTFFSYVTENNIDPKMVLHYIKDFIYQIIHTLRKLKIGMESCEILEEVIHKLNDYNITIKELFQDIILALQPYFDNGNDNGSTEVRPEIIRAIQYMQSNYAKNIELKDVASYVGLSRNHFCTIFHNETGEKFISYLSRVRVEKSKKYLMDYQNRIQEVAYRVGIDNPRYFCKLFKDYTGMSPSEYREKNL